MVAQSPDDRNDTGAKNAQTPSREPQDNPLPEPQPVENTLLDGVNGVDTAWKLSKNRPPVESLAIHETRVRGTSPHANAPQPQTSIVSESVSSLLNRLGTPPADLTDHLVDRFERICHDLEDSAHPIRDINLDDWHVTQDGDLLFRPAETPEENTESALSTSSQSDTEVLTTRALADTFRKHLVQPRPGGIRPRGRPNELPEFADARSRFDLDDRYDGDLDNAAGDDQVQLTDVEVQNRDKIVSMFTDALTERFGAEVIAPPDPPADESRTPKIQPLTTDRRFNWNMVLGIGSAVVVLAFIYAGYRVTKNRQRWLAERIPTSPIEISRKDVPENTLRESDKKDALSTRKRPKIDPADIKPLTPSAGSAFAENRPQVEATDPLETLQSLESSETPMPAEAEFNEFGMRINAKKMVKVETPSKEPANGSSKSTDGGTLPDKMRSPSGAPLTDESLDKALTEELEKLNIPESPQVIRRGTQSFAHLPATNRSDRYGTIPIDLSAIEDLEFPVDTEIELSSGPTKTFVHTPSQTVLARLSEVDGETRFTWTSDAKNQSSAIRLNHGRLVDSDGQRVYLRPSIASDPFQLSLAARQARPTWNLGPAILTAATRLDLDINLPGLIEYGWAQKFDSTNPRRGRAVAILTPPDGESVAVALQINVRCSRKLECYLKYAVRLDPTLPWQPITKEGLYLYSRALRTQSTVLESQRNNFDRMYADADSVQRKLLRRQRDELERQEEELEFNSERTALVKTLVESIESSVTLDMHLYVQWPDQKQTIFRTTVPR